MARDPGPDSSSVGPVLRQMGLNPGTVGFNNAMFSALDLRVEPPKALPGYLQNLSISKDFVGGHLEGAN